MIALAACTPKPSGESAANEKSEKTSIFDQIAQLDGRVTFTLEDAENLSRENPDSFWIPARGRRESLVEEDLVKLIFNISDGDQTQGERMWVLVKSADRSRYIGVLDNDPHFTDQIKAGLEVEFEPRHVIDIYEVEFPVNHEAEQTKADNG